ncbi:hypothetical protein FBU30_003639 [Linnemannia zychae]|nr:hypothetical protein FBU30_003639 [Linnemannia zychae]
MSSISPSSTSSDSPVFGNGYSDDSSISESSPSTPAQSCPLAAMAITELVISEAHYLTAIKRVGSALNQVAAVNHSAGHKESSTLRSVCDRWSELTRMHTKFHDDVVTANENLRETAGLLNVFLVTLEPILMDHSRDLSISLKKLIRRDQSSEFTAAEWEMALRQPLDHLSSYEEWLLRIDPQQKFCKAYSSHLQGLIYKSKMVSDANHQPRNMLRRLSTMARGVIKRRSSVQLLTQGESIAETPITPTTPTSASTLDSTLDSRCSEKSETLSPLSTRSPTTSLPMLPDVAVKVLEITESTNDLTIDTVTKPASVVPETTSSPLEKNLPMLPLDIPQTPTSSQEPTTPIADTFLAPPQDKQLHHFPSSTSELSSTGTLAAPTPTSQKSLASSSASIHSKASSSVETIIQIHTQEHIQIQRSNVDNTFTRQKFLEEKEARKATLRVGTSEIIQAKAYSLQSPSYKSRSSAESAQRLSPTKSEADKKKPPVKSLISFWEQVSDPLDA